LGTKRPPSVAAGGGMDTDGQALALQIPMQQWRATEPFKKKQKYEKRATDFFFITSERLNGIKQLPLCRAAHHAVAVRFFILQKFIYAICFSSQFSPKIMQLHRSEAGSSQTHAALSFSSCVQASHRTVNGVRWSAQGDSFHSELPPAMAGQSSIAAAYAAVS